MSDEFERNQKILQLAHLRDLAEKAYDDMYEQHSFSGSGACYSDAKEFYYDAIQLAEELGLAEESAAMTKRLEHIKGVFRSQFS